MNQFHESDTDLESITTLSRRALVVGIDRYRKPFSSLFNAANDAKAAAKVLLEDYSFAMTLLLDEMANKATIESEIKNALKSGADTRWLFYFAGHGTVENGQGFLLPADAEKGNLQSFVALQDLLQTCVQSDCGEVLIILDACYSGRGFVRPDILDNPAPNAEERRVRQIIAAGNPHEMVLDGGADNHSLFTASLLEVLNGWTGAHDNQGRVTFSKLRDELAYQIPANLRSMGYSTISQQPLGGNFQSNIDGRQFTFTPRIGVQRLSPEIVRDLRSGDSERRVSGWRSIPFKAETDTHAQSAAMAVWTLMNDSSESVRGAAAATLGSLPKSEATVQVLIDALADKVTVCRAAAKSLGELKAVDAGGALLGHLLEAPTDLFLDFTGAIGEMGDPSLILSALRVALQRKMLVPFIGPDLPQELTGVKSREDFVKEFSQHEGIDLSDSLAQVANIATRNGQQRHSLVRTLKDAYGNPLQKPGPFYEALKNLDAPFWLSACYDNLLAKTIDANLIVIGEDTKYWRTGRPTVVRLVGDPGSIRGLVVLEKEYEYLRENEGDRKLLLSFLHQELQGKIVLLLGYDPASRDFALLVKYMLNQHLAGVSTQAFLVRTGLTSNLVWNGQSVQIIQEDALKLVTQLSINS
jgi:hypothetical protein